MNGRRFKCPVAIHIPPMEPPPSSRRAPRRIVRPPEPPVSARRQKTPRFGIRETPSVDDILFTDLVAKIDRGGCSGERCFFCNRQIGVKPVTVFSCCHFFHSSCIGQTSRCPLCRKVGKFARANLGGILRHKAAITIQRVVRGYLSRIKLAENAVPGSELYRKTVLKSARFVSDRLIHAIEDQSDAVDAVLCSIDKELEWARSIMKACDARRQEVDWDAVKERAKKTAGGCCPICLQQIQLKHSAVTSCEHLFHPECLTHWIQCCAKEQSSPTCPVCRSFFQYRYMGLINNPVMFCM